MPHLASTQGKPNNSKLEIKEQDNFEYSKKTSMNNDQCGISDKPLDQDYWDAIQSQIHRMGFRQGTTN
jgi:hypothetical protein